MTLVDEGCCVYKGLNVVILYGNEFNWNSVDLVCSARAEYGCGL